MEISEKELDVSTLSGIGPATKKKLNEVGIYTLMDLVVFSPGYLMEVLGTSMEKAIHLQDRARQKLEELGLLPKDYITADELMEKMKSVEYITTGSKNLDNLLMGGVETQAITEFYGEFGTGKTQICHSLSVNVQLSKDSGGLNSGAIYLDTEKTFRPSRIMEIASARGLDPKEALKRIHVAKVFNSGHLMALVRGLGRKILETGARLVVVDSAVAPFRAEYIGRDKLAERQQTLNTLMHELSRIAELYNVAVVITNQVQAAPDVFFGDPRRPTGGHVVAHAVTYRIYLRKGKGDTRIAAIQDSPHHPPGEAVFTITKEGIRDP